MTWLNGVCYYLPDVHARITLIRTENNEIRTHDIKTMLKTGIWLAAALLLVLIWFFPSARAEMMFRNGVLFSIL